MLLAAAEKVEVHTLEAKDEQQTLFNSYMECLEQARALVTGHKANADRKTAKTWQAKISSASRTVNMKMLVLRHKFQRQPSGRGRGNLPSPYGRFKGR